MEQSAQLPAGHRLNAGLLSFAISLAISMAAMAVIILGLLSTVPTHSTQPTVALNIAMLGALVLTIVGTGFTAALVVRPGGRRRQRLANLLLDLVIFGVLYSALP